MSAQDYYAAARQMLEDKRPDEAYDLAKKSVAASPNKDNHYLRGYLAYYHAEDYDIALESAKYCIENQHQLKRNYPVFRNGTPNLAVLGDDFQKFGNFRLFFGMQKH